MMFVGARKTVTRSACAARAGKLLDREKLGALDTLDRGGNFAPTWFRKH